MALAIDFITTNEYSNTVIIPINKELEEKMTISQRKQRAHVVTQSYEHNTEFSTTGTVKAAMQK